MPLESSWIGRDAELEQLAALIASGRRLVSVTGPPGVGKTRLARALLEDNDGVLCDLSEATDADSVVAAVAERLGAAAPDHASIAIALGARGETLVVLDNFEQVTPHAAETIGVWMEAAPRARFVVTSVRSLGLSAERTMPLEPLTEADALALWAERVAAQVPSYDVDADRENASRIVRKLDRIPLAIELAAGRMGVLGSEALLRRLADRFSILSRGARDKPARHQTLRTAIEAWWELLDEPAREGLKQLTVFRGGFTADAAEAVLELDSTPVLEVLEELREGSFLQPQHTGEPRFGLYVAIRDYAARHLSLDERGAAEARLADWLLRETSHWLDTNERTGDLVALRKLVAERYNLLALARSANATPAQRACATAALAAISFQTVPIQGIDVHVDVALTGIEPSEAPACVARLLLVRGIFLHREGDDERAQPLLAQAQGLAEAHGLGVLQSRAIFHRGVSKLYAARDYDEAAKLFEEAARVASVADATRSEAAALGELGTVALASANPEAARRCFERALAIAQTDGRDTPKLIQLAKLAHAAMELGEHEVALAHANDALRGCGESLPVTQGHALACRGFAALDAGDARAAVEDFARGHACLAEMAGQSRNAAWLRYGEALAREASGDVAEARRGLTDATLALARTGSVFTEPARALLAAMNGEPLEPAPELDPALGGYAATVRLYDACARLGPDAETRRAAAELVRDTEDVAGRSIDARLARRRLAAALAALDQAQPRSGWSWGEGGAWFSTPDGDRVELSASPVLGRILGALLAARGQPLGIDRLRAAAWPDERMSEGSGRQRVRANVARLRKMGLRSVLRSDARGYWLDASAFGEG